jgi:hypothetical protein
VSLRDPPIVNLRDRISAARYLYTAKLWRTYCA